MAAILAGEAAVRIVPTLKNFHSEVRKGLRSQPHSLDIKVNPNLKEADAQMAEWRRRQELNAVKVPVRADFQTFQKDLSQVEHIFQRSSLSKAIRINLVVAGLDALPALAYAAGSAASGLDALGESALALPGILGGALSSAAALATGIHGVKDAFKAFSQDADKASESARKQKDADRDLTSAKRNLQDAIRDQKREIEDLNAEMRRSSLNEADAVLSIQEDLNRLRQGGFKDVTEYQRAVLGLLRDEDRLNTVRTQGNRTIQDATRANQQGVAQSDRVQQALDRVAKATEALDESKVTKVSQALAKLSPNAAAAVQAIHGLQGEWTKLVQTPTQDALFAGLDKDITNLSRSLPLLGQGLSGVAKGLNSDIRAVISSLGPGQNQSLITRIFGDTQGGLQNASRGINSLLHGFLQLTSASANFLPRLGDAADKVFTKFDGWVTKISQNGSLSKWIDTGLKAIDELGRSVGHIVSIVHSVSDAFDTASGHTGGFLQNLDHATQRLADFLNTTKGQSDLINYFKQAGQFAQLLIQAYKDAKPFLHDLIETSRQWSGVVLESVGSLGHLASIVERNTGLIKPLVEAYLTFRTVKPIIEGVSGAWKAYSIVMDAVARQGGVGGVASGAMDNLKGKLNGLGREAEATSNGALQAYQKAVGGATEKSATWGTGLKNLAGYIGPGLAFTAAVGGASFAIQKLGEAHEKAAQQANDQRAALDQLNQTLDKTSGAATTATIAQTGKNFQNYSIPNIGDVNVNKAAAGLNINTQDLARAAGDPTAQALRDKFHDQFVTGLTKRVDDNPQYQKFKQAYDDAGISDRDIALAMMSDPASLAKYNSLMQRADGLLSSGGSPGAGDSLLSTGVWGDIGRALHGEGGRLPSLSDFLGSSGDLGKVAFAYNNSAMSTGNAAQSSAAASQYSSGKFTLSSAGNSAFGAYSPDPNVYIDDSGRAQVRLNRAPNQAEQDALSQKGATFGQPLAGGGILVTIPANSPDIQQMATGGLVRGVGGPTDDANLVAMSAGEHVAKAKAVDYYGPQLFDDLNNMRIPKHSGGGFQLDTPFVPIPAPPIPWMGPQESQFPPIPSATPAAPSPAAPSEPTWGGAHVGAPVTGIPSSLAPTDMPDPTPVAPSSPTPTPVAQAPLGPGSLLGGAGTGGGKLTANGLVDSGITPTLPLTAGLNPGEKPYAGQKSVTPGFMGALEQWGIPSGGLFPVGSSAPKAGSPSDDHVIARSPSGAEVLLPRSAATANGYPIIRGGGASPDPSLTHPPVGTPHLSGTSAPGPQPHLQGNSPGAAHPGATAPALTAGPGGTPLTPSAGLPPGMSVMAPAGIPGIAAGTPLPQGRFSEKGLQNKSVGVLRLLEQMFPQVGDIGGWRPPDGYNEHSSGQALDVMLPNYNTPQGQALGNQIKQFLLANGPALGVDYVLYDQTQWNPDGSSSPMENRGSDNDNHRTHLHVHTTGGGYPTGASDFLTPQLSAAIPGLPSDASPQDVLNALGDPASLGLPPMPGVPGGIPGSGIPGLDVGGAGGLPSFLQPENMINFFGGQLSNVGQGISQIGLQFLQGITGINLSPLLGAAQGITNGAIQGYGGKGSGGSGGGLGQLSGLLGGGGGSGLNAIAGGNMAAFVKGQLPLGARPGTQPTILGDPTLGGGPSGAGGGSGGAERWRPLVRQMLMSVGPQYGITAANEKQWEDAIVRQIGSESGGNPNSVNNHDSNGRGGTQSVGGLLNFLPSTFAANNVTGGSFMDPSAQIAAAIPYVVQKYGFNSGGGPNHIGQGVGFASGGFPDGSALVSHGEYITNKNAVANYGPGLFTALNSMSIPKKSIGGFYGKFDGGGFAGLGLDVLQPPPMQPNGQTPGPLPLDAPAPPPTPAAAPGPEPVAPDGPPALGAPAEQPQVAAPSSTGGPPGPGATAPAPDPGGLPKVEDALKGLSLPKGGGGGGGAGPAQPGASASTDKGKRATLGAAPKSQEHNLPAVSKGIQGAASTIGSLAAMAAQIGISAGTMGAGSPAAGAAAQGIQAGAQMAGQVATGAVNILSSLLVGTATPGTTDSASGVPLLPQRQPMQTGVPQVQQQVHQGDVNYNLTNLDDFSRTQQRLAAQDVMPHISKYGA